jgi:hypothetical protein
MYNVLPHRKDLHDMTRKPTREPAKRKQPAASETSQSIEEQTRIFLNSGKKIDVIQPGISGVPSMTVNRHIRLGNKAE